MEEQTVYQRKFLEKFIRFLHFLNGQIPQLGVQEALDFIVKPYKLGQTILVMQAILESKDSLKESSGIDILENLNLGLIQSTVRINFEEFWADNYKEGEKLCAVIEREVSDERWGVDEEWTALTRIMLAGEAVELMKKTNLLNYVGYHTTAELGKVLKEHDTKLDAVLNYISGEGEHEKVNKMLRYILDLALAYKPELTPVPNATAEIS
jgi:hypothetical protein